MTSCSALALTREEHSAETDGMVAGGRAGTTKNGFSHTGATTTTCRRILFPDRSRWRCRSQGSWEFPGLRKRSPCWPLAA